MFIFRSLVAALVLAAALVLPGAASGAVPLTQVLVDPFTNPQSQHQTVVEPDTFAFGNTIVSVAQVGRYFDGGASGTGFATSVDGGANWTSGTVPGLTIHQTPAGQYDRVTDPVVAYDAQDGVWLAQSLALVEAGGLRGEAIVVNRSTDGINWSGPIVSAQATPDQDFDKNWIVCDNTPTSPHFGNCYQQWDDFADGDRILMNRSTDGGLTWSQPVQTADGATGLGGQPVVQPDGDVIVPAGNAFLTAIIAFRSTDGGVTWSNSVLVSPAPTHAVAGDLRTDALPSAEVDSAGRVFLVWQDCRFRKGCKANDIVMSTTTDGLTWTPVARVPLDSTTGGVDHFIPGIGVEPTSTGRLALTYYFYRVAKCGNRRNPCQLEVGYSQSEDGGATWSTPTDVAGPFQTDWTADTTQGRMVGDYISTSWLGGRAWTAVPVAGPPAGTVFDEDLYVPTGGLTPAAGGFVNTSKGEHPVADAASDHAAPRSAIRSR
jgi:BNR repeat-like domain